MALGSFANWHMIIVVVVIFRENSSGCYELMKIVIDFGTKVFSC